MRGVGSPFGIVSPFTQRRVGGDPLASLFANGEDGSLPSLDFTFTDLAGTLPATWGDSVRRVDDTSANGQNWVTTGDAFRPLFGRAPVDVRNLLTRTEEFDDSGWIKNGVSVADIGDGKFNVIPDNGEGARKIKQRQLAFGNIDTTFQVFLEDAGARYCRLYFGRQSNRRGHITIDLQDGSYTVSVSGATITNVSITANGNGWDVSLSINIVLGTIGSSVSIICSTTPIPASDSVTVSVTGDGTSAVTVGYPQFELGSTATNYQRVGSALDITEAGIESFPYLRPDLAEPTRW